MARKKYTSGSSIGINVLLEGNVNHHVSFIDKSNGSYLITDDPALQEALEKHPRFGSLFRLEENIETARTNHKPKREPRPEEDENPKDAEGEAGGTDAEEQTEDTDTPETGAESDLKTVNVTCPDDAKEYLSEHFDVSRSKMKSTAKIKEEGKKHGILFEGI